MSSRPPRDFLERARAVSASILFAAGAAAVIGALLDWLVATRLPPTIPDAQADRVPPFSGIELGDGWVVMAGAVVLMLAAFGIVLRGRYGWVAFLAALVMGAVSMGDYRSIDGLAEETEAIGAGLQPGIGLTLCVAASIAGMIAAVTAIAASSRPERQARSTE